LWTDVFLDPERIGLASNLCPVGMPSNACAPPNQLLWYIDDFTDDVNYTAEQRIDAAYAMVEVPLVPKLDLIAGARYETTYLHVVPVNLISGQVNVVRDTGSGNHYVEAIPQEQAITDIDEAALLPAVALVWKPESRMNVRVSWSRTVARPQYRELAPAQTQEYLAGDNFVGNPALTLSDITNWDARWEWFRRAGDVLAASVFYKSIRDPIELISFYAIGRDVIQPINYRTGSVRGVEIEARTDLGAYAGWARGLFAGVNATWLDSEVDVPPQEQAALSGADLDEPTRALQGQPEYLLNAFVTYENDRTGTSAGVFFNRTGDTLLTGAAFGIDNSTPNVFERAFGVLDVSASQKIRKKLNVGFRARNVLEAGRGSVFRDPRGNESIKVDRSTARRFSVSIGYKW
jgi:TonB-dependent receptor